MYNLPLMHAFFHDLGFIQMYVAHVQEMDHLMLPFLNQNVTVCAFTCSVCVVLNGYLTVV